MKNSSYVDEVLYQFRAEYEGKYIDVTGVYGAQSPDLVQAYISRLLGREWIFKAGPASRLWEDSEGTMTDFERVERNAPLRRGDVLVFDGGQGFGTVGIYTAPGARVGSVQMVTQNPGPVDVIDILVDGHVHNLLGAWRLTDAAECVAAAERYAWQHGLTQAEQEIEAEFDKGYAHIETLPKHVRKRTEAWLRSQDPRVNYVEADPVPGWGEFKPTVGGMRHGKTSLIERLKARFGRKP